MKVWRLTAAVVAVACAAVQAEVRLASVFSDHMVLQRDKDLRVWGTATPGKMVTVEVAGEKGTAKADDGGKWTVKLGKAGAKETPVELTAREEGANTVTLSDVLVGDVWVCSGQSNMEFRLEGASNAAEAVPAATDQKLRLLLVPRNASQKPLEEQPAKWVVCSPEEARRFSAVGYFFGKEIRANQHVPVGLIGTYWGGTQAEAWTPAKFLTGEDYAPFKQRAERMLASYEKDHAGWEQKVKEWEEKHKTDPKLRRPTEPLGAKSPNQPSVLWNGMVQPLVPMSIEGVIWYQGESNASRAEEYRTLFPTLITAWRQEFEQGDFPFLFVQLANYVTKSDTETGSPWAELREAQAMTLQKVPNTGMACIIDVGNPGNIHPTDKQTVGKRLALAAEKLAYGQDVVFQGPTYRSVEVQGNLATVDFADVDGGLVVKGEKLKGFTVAGEDHKFVPADAKVEGDRVVVSAKGVQTPMAVRYGWADNPEANLYNKAGLPAVPFRTDDWPLVTAGKR